MPINRPDGRHWCAPEDEPPTDDVWTCPDCGQEWVFGYVEDRATWETPEGRAERLKFEKQVERLRAASVQPENE